ncbi:olfactory receptor 52N1-like [Zootoca vivipara]|uniref:olfactory receptor 52N1-like n=1 Tax=Zootoca vivipara TaxID=8524 RepID=UPI0015909422|nr:olfactory receptor 52N1-like [Zootoca vivipara]XP_034972309.1 olfactory receptor 52N1-like [Zootoca vivipara]
MAAPNGTGKPLLEFILNGIPGLEHAHLWISFPFFSMYLIGMVGNCGLLYIIWTEEALHRPMYWFLCMLSITDIVMGTSTMPKAFCIFWLNLKEIDFNSCLVQMYVVHTFTGMESGVLMLMALDRFVAICYPLRYATILTNSLILKVGLVTFIRGAVLILPFPFLVRKMQYCNTNVIAHTYCDHMAVVKLACGSIHVDAIYGLTVALLIGGFDIFCIAVSYFMILKAVVALSSKEARSKAFGTCSAHICAITISYTPAFFTFFAHRFGGHSIAPHVHIIMANLYLLLPPMMNPIVYGVKTKEIRETVLRLFRKGKTMGPHGH